MLVTYYIVVLDVDYKILSLKIKNIKCQSGYSNNSNVLIITVLIINNKHFFMRVFHTAFHYICVLLSFKY